MTPQEKLNTINSYTDPTQRLLEVMRQLRNPDGGCPWDLEQDFKSIAKYTIEEAYEVADAIESGNIDDIKDELGDLLLQVVFHAQIATDDDLFTFDDVASHVVNKMVERHPHVFQETKADSADDVVDVWENQKEKQKPRESAMDGVTVALPALLRAQKLQKRAARAGFEWNNVSGAIEKFKEEMTELETEIMSGKNDDAQREEFGDVLFTLVNIGRMMGYDVEETLRETNQKFETRFRGMEHQIKASHQSLENASLDEMEEAWQAQKQKLKASA